MICPGCTSTMTDDCRYCPRCGQATALAPQTDAEIATAAPTDTAHTDTADAIEAVTEKSPTCDLAVSSALTGPILSLEKGTLPPEALRSLLTQANLHRLRAQWTEAVDCCVAVLRSHPGDQTAHALLGDIYADQNKLDDAIRWYRMAVDLRPNAVDAARLKQLEEARERLLPVAEARFRSQSLSALPPDGSLSGGTALLMGISPRRWLNGLTIASLGFAVLLFGGLFVVQARRRQTIPKPGATTIRLTSSASPAGTGSVLPAPSSPASTSLSGSNTVRQTAPAAGTGFRPDSTTGSGRARADIGQPRVEALPGLNSDPAARDLPPAPVFKVQPLPGDADQPSVAAAAPASTDRFQSRSLPDGMVLAQMHRDPDSRAVSLLVTSSLHSPSEIDSRLHESMVRNIFRAARSVFADNPGMARLTIYIQAGSESAGGGTTLALAEIDRVAAQTTAPDSTPLSTLENRLRSLRFAEPPSSDPAQTTPAAPARSSRNDDV